MIKRESKRESEWLEERVSRLAFFIFKMATICNVVLVEGGDDSVEDGLPKIDDNGVGGKLRLLLQSQ